MTDIDLSGVYPAIVTPFNADDSIDFDRLTTLVRDLEDRGVDGIVPVGSTGESATLTHDEHIEVVEAVVDTVSVPVIAGAGSNSTHEAVSLAQRSADVGADALLLLSPYYNKPEPTGMEEHFRRIADAVDLPQIVYNVPSRTGRNVEVDTTVSLAEHPNVAGYKAASGDLGMISELAERTQDLDFTILSGDDGLTLPIMSVGGEGVISVAANVEPERTSALVEAALADDYATARSTHHELGPLFRTLFIETNPIPVKEAVAQRYGWEAHYRLPLSPPSDEHRAVIRDVLADLEEPIEA
mgnify:CR=1 FL=1